MRLTNRVLRLEQSRFASQYLSVMARFAKALNDSALRTTGQRWDAVQADPAAQAQVFHDLDETFTRGLSAEDLAILTAELERIAASEAEA